MNANELRIKGSYGNLLSIMQETTFKISPVNIEQRKKLEIKPGDTVRVHQKIQEKGKTRIQVFEGLVLAVKHGKEPGGTFTVRKVASGVGVEKIFPIYSPIIDKIEIVKRSKVRRAKLYYIREKVAREIRRKMRNMKIISLTTEEEEKPTEDDEEKDEAVEETKTEEAKTESGEDVKEEKTDEETKESEDKKEEKEEEEPKEEKEEIEKKD